MRETDVDIDNGGIVLRGSLAVPDGPAAPPVILFIHGSGPLDRNENVKGAPLNVFSSLAHALAQAGYASLRYDKRGCGKSGGSYAEAGHFDLVSDARACIDRLTSGALGPFGRLYLLGHSEGTLIAAELAQAGTAAAGIILICPFVRDVETILHQQAAVAEREVDALGGFSGFAARLMVRLIGKPTAIQRKVIARIKASQTPTIRIMLRTFEAKSLRELMALDPRRIYEGVDVPALVFGAAKDVQCDPADVAAIAALLGPAATAHVEPDLTHILRKDGGPAGFAAYRRQIREPIDPSVAAHVLAWMRQAEANASAQTPLRQSEAAS